jgi:amidohydrolase
MQNNNWKLSSDTRAAAADLVAIRRDIHQHPEPGFQEKRTSALIEQTLKRLGIETKRMCGTGVVGLLRGGKPGPTMLMRADMDALPVTEENDVPYRSRSNGFMHACGHDAHVAMGLTAAKLLAKRRASLAGCIKFMFQPAEEGPGGAKPLIEAGILKRPTVDMAFAMHVWNELPVGKIGVRPGPVFASADEWKVTIHGRGGHGAAPHQTIDPVVVAAHVVVALQTIVSRKVDPLKSAVVTVGKIQGGTRQNIIPDRAELFGTVRALEEGVRVLVKRELERVAKGVAASLGAKATLEYTFGYPATVNDGGATEIARLAAAEVVGGRNAVQHAISMGEIGRAHV